MTDANYYRAQAELSFQIASSLSDKTAADDVRAAAWHQLLRAEQIDAVERRFARLLQDRQRFN